LETTGLAFQEESLVTGTQTLPRFVEWYASFGSDLTQEAASTDVARFGPGIDRSIGECAVCIGNYERLIIFEHGAESIARLTGAPGVVERKEVRREHHARLAAGDAPWSLGELPSGFIDDGFSKPIALGERHREGVRDATAHRWGRLHSVNDY
jgi:hypothetical protein